MKLKNSTKLATVAATVLLGLTLGASAGYADSTNPTPSEGTDIPTNAVERLYNPNTGEHLYTISHVETSALQSSGWKYEGIGWYAPAMTTSGEYGQPVYRLFNPRIKGGDHYYTKNLAEAKSLVSKGWKMDNGGKPVFLSGGPVSVYVVFNPRAKASGSHNYSTNLSEQKGLVSKGWTYLSTAFQGWPSSNPKSVDDPNVIGSTYAN